MKKNRTYWNGRFDSDDSIIRLLPVQGPQFSASDGKLRSYSYTFSGEMSQRMKAIGNGSSMLLFTILLAGVECLLHQYTQEEHIVLGMPVVGKDGAPLLNDLLLLKHRVIGTSGFKSLLGEIHSSVGEAVAHQNVPFQTMIGPLDIQYDPNGRPVVHTMVCFNEIHTMSFLENTAVDILFAFESEQDSIGMKLMYNERLYDPAFIERLAEHLNRVYSVVLYQPEHRIDLIDLLSEAEKTQLLVEFNDTAQDYPREKTVHRLFEEQAQRTPGHTAAVCGDSRLTYRELNEKANRLAWTLRENGVRPGHVVGMMTEPSLEMAVGILGILKAGAGYVPIAPEQPQDRIRHILEDSGARLLLTQRRLSERAAFAEKRLYLDEAAAYCGSDSNPESDTGPDGLAYIIYTSGTTGLPKGVQVTHQGVSNFVSYFVQDVKLSGSDKSVLTSSYSFDLSLTSIFPVLLSGGELHLLGKEQYMEPELLLRYIREHRITFLKMAPSLFSMIVNSPAFDSNRDAEAVRIIVLGGEEFRCRDAAAYFERYPSVQFMNSYGPTETTISCVTYLLDRTQFAEFQVRPVIGKPIPNTKIYIVGVGNRLQPVGVPGEILIGGDGVSRGYIGLLELQRQKFISSPFVDGETLYRTGDLARWLPDGNIEILGRIDHQVKIRGYRIELSEVEARLSDIAGVQEAAVMARDDEAGEKLLCAYVVADRPLPGGELRNALAGTLPEYMIPSYFVQLEKLPLTPNGKIDRKALPAPETAARTGADYVAPRTPLEAKLTQLWEEVLGLRQVGVTDDFFKIGGHSLRAMTLVSRIYKEMRINLPLHAIFQNPTIEGMAQAIEGMEQTVYAAIPRVGERDYYPLSSAQKRLYILNQIEGAQLTYNMPGIRMLVGRLDRKRLEDAFRALIERHETLRTGFEVFDGEPVQRVYPRVDFALEYRQADEEEADGIIRSFVREFDLRKPPLLRVGLIRLREDRHILCFDMHHIVSDGISMNVLMREFSLLYEGREPVLPDIQYKDYAAWQQAELQSERMKAQEAYWLNVFRGEIQVLDLPTDYARPAERSYLGDTFEFVIDKPRLEGLKQLAAETGATLYMVLLAAYTVLLHKYTEQTDIVVGTPIAGRPHADLEHLIGMFAGTLALRNYLAPEKTFRDYVREVKEHALHAYENQDYPFEQLVEKLNVARDASRNPLFDTMFILQNAEEHNADIDGLAVEPYPRKHTTAKFDLSFHASEETHRIVCSIEYASALFKPETVLRMARHFTQLLDGIVQDPNGALSSIEIVTAQEKTQIVEEFNDTSCPFPADMTIHGLFEQVAAGMPEQEAVVFQDRRLTYRELNERANRLARTLRAKGLQAEQPVAIMSERSVEMIVAVLAVMKAGGAYVPVDPEYPEKRIRYMLEDSGVRLLLVQSHLQDRAAFDSEVLLLDDDRIYSDDGSNLGLAVDPQQLAYIIYTSGTTGNPKGVMVEHQGVCNFKFFCEHTLQISKQDRIVQFASFSFDASCSEIIMSLFFGATLYVPDASVILDHHLFEQYVRDNGITVATLPPTYAVYLNPAHVPSLKTLITAGSASSAELVAQWKDHVRYINNYGPTEDSICSTTWVYSKDMAMETSVPIGRPIANHQVYILDAQNRLAPVGVAGELCVSGIGLARGYLNRPELTAEKFVPVPFAPEKRMYRTGDLARWLPDGNIEYLGRIDHQVKIRGHRIELGEVEAKLLKVESVREVIVVAREGESGQASLCAYFVADRDLTASELRGALAQELPGYMIPSYFVRLEQMPLTPNGKPDLHALPAPEEDLQGGAEYVAPRTPAEQTLIQIWQTVLGSKRIGALDNFFDLGGDSIKSIQVSSRLRQAGYKLEVKDLFKYQTAAELSPHLKPVSRSADQGEVKGEAPLTPIQRWFFTRSCEGPEPGQEQGSDAMHHFNQVVMVYREQGFNEMALRQAVKKITEHHDALRMVFRQSENVPASWNRGTEEGEAYRLDVFDFREVDDCATAVESHANKIQRSLDIARGPLMKLGLFRCPDGDHLLITIHHLVVDGVSWRILVEDLQSGYEQAANGQAIRLPDKTDSFFAWAEHLASHAGSPAMENERAYWERVCQEGGSRLPRDMEQSRTLMRDNEFVQVRLTPEETEQLLTKTHRAYNTEMNDLLLTALGMAVQRWAATDRILVDLEGHGREPLSPDIDITRTVGWFTTQYPVLLEMGEDQELAYRIKRVKEHLRRIPHKGIGYGILKYMCPGPEGAALDSEPEIGFNYLGQFDQDLQNTGLRPSPYSSGAAISGNMERFHLLDVNGLIAGGQLTMSISYSGAQYRRETMERLASLLQTSLREVIAHCAKQERTELTPSDILFKDMTIEELDRLVASIRHMGEIENVYALTPMQKGMLFHRFMDSESHAYFEQTSFTLRGSLDVDAFRKSLDTFVERNEALRTNFYSGWKQEPVQVVFRDRRAGFRYEDLRAMTEAESENYIAVYIRENKAAGFDLEKDELMRVTILRTGDEIYRFLWSFHHILMDGWCLSLAAKEVFEAYFAYRKRRQPDFDAAPPYSRYIEWLERQDREAASAFWADYLDGYEQQTVLLGAQSTEEKKPGHVAEKVDCVLAKSLTRQIQQTAKRHQVTLNTLVQAAWGVLLKTYNGSQDVVFGSVVSGRPAEIPGIETMIGLFINTIPVRIRCQDEDTFASLMQRVQEQALAAQAYDTYPLYDIQAQSGLKQGLINHIFVFENYPVDQQMRQLGKGDAAEFEITDVSTEEQTSYDLNVIVVPGDELRIRLDYNALAYDRTSMEKIRGHLLRVMEQIADNPHIGVNELDVLTEEEKLQITGVFNDTETDYPREKTLHLLFEEQVRKTPEKTAVAFGESVLTYRELNERANKLARTLRSEGVCPDQPVGLMADRSLEMIVGTLGILKAGGAYVPIDPEYPEERIRYMLEDSGAKLLLVQDGERMRADFAGKIVDLSQDDAYSDDSSNPDAAAGPTDLAYIMYTSGTTGKPKGVMVEHRNVVRLVKNTNFADLNIETRILQTGAVAFDASTFEIWGALLNGGELYLTSQDVILNAVKLKQAIQQYGITTMWLTSPLFNQLSQEYSGLFGGLKTLLVGGDALSVPHINRVLRDHPGLCIVNGYGPTENTTFSTTFAITGEQTDSVPIGRPIRNSTAYVVDSTLKLQPVGAWGELIVGGDGVARGYLNRPELTAEKFIASPVREGERCYRTGDLVRWRADGTLEYKGRMDGQVKIRGYRIELGEVEARLLKVPSVEAALVTVHEDEAGQKLLCAYYTAEYPLPAGELRSALAAVLPGYMIPSYFVQLEQMPLTLNGKVDRNALPAPAEAGGQSAASLEAPRTATEAQLLRIWQDVLGTRSIGIQDNFFEIGGHSLRATTLAAKIHKELNWNISLRDIFQSPTIEGLAKVIEAMEQQEFAAIPVAEKKPYYPVSSAQKRLYLIQQMEGTELIFNLPGIMSLEGPLELKRLEEAFQALIARHETLRTGFGLERGEPVQRVYSEVPFSVEYRQANEKEADEIVRSFVRPFDLAQPPLLRVGLIELEPERHILLLDMHHMISDGAAMGVLADEFFRLYKGEELQPLRIQYKDYAVWQQSEEQMRRRKEQEAYWLHALSGDLPVLAMPTKYARPAVRSHEGELFEFVIDEHTSESLRQLATAAGSTLYMVLMAAYTVLLHKYTGQGDIIVGTPIAGRVHADLEPLIGMFVNMLPIRSYPAGGKSFRDYLEEVRETTLMAFENQSYPFEEMVEKLQVPYDPSRSPLFDTMFVMQNTEKRGVPDEALRILPYARPHMMAKYDLTLEVVSAEEDIRCRFEYCTKLFAKKMIDNLAHDFMKVLAHIGEQPQIRLGDIALLENEPTDEDADVFEFVF
ncbi:non-ribosomal peptide synthetase [Paenibacillus elgii]|uniref:Non-ribosomal peptide synthetase n=2 Tax=Paenibacillus elgii TaxID=189691 RepID=A0A2T6FX97_9BACL|nr:non-ribosomal peptide synthetase [Paenibacillus elgii]